jgi:FKBP-type peptidyl-prolyl cis-trans isomerase (trigger factor)
MRRRVRLVLEFEDVAGQEYDEVTEGEILEAMDGAFEMVLSEQQSESIDDLEAALVRMQYEVSRKVLARQLADLAKKKLAEQRTAADASSTTLHRIELTVNLADLSSRLVGSKTTRGR